MRQIRRGIVALGLLLALVPLSAHAADGNQAAIDKARAEKAALESLPFYEQTVALGQQEIINARAIAQLLRYDAHAQTELPNSMQQYDMFCDAAITHVQANMINAAAMAQAKPWDTHAQDELANANATYRTLWNMIGDTYMGNPFIQQQVRGPSQAPLLSDDQLQVADDEVMASGDDALVASTDEVAVPDEEAAAVADGTGEVTPE
ncbi:MAG TPA: hypothetical protein VKV73_30975 [Chloroflexota bacterium]|nr:hypothetical protein [Chloroflexota bacterium]